MKITKLQIRWRTAPHDAKCYCAKYPIYTKWFIWPTDALGWSGAETRLWIWLWWELLLNRKPDPLTRELNGDMKITFTPNKICLRCGNDRKEARKKPGSYRASHHIWNKEPLRIEVKSLKPL